MPVNLHKIKRAKDIGKKLRIARDEQGQNLAILASQCGMSVVQLVALESGNHYPFNNSFEDMFICARNYARLLELDISIDSTLGENLLALNDSELIDQAIPQFLIKKT